MGWGGWRTLIFVFLLATSTKWGPHPAFFFAGCAFEDPSQGALCQLQAGYGTCSVEWSREIKNKNKTMIAGNRVGHPPSERTFNLVPGFECLPVQIAMQPGEEVRVEISTEKGRTLRS